jgi:hypothetical protein
VRSLLALLAHPAVQVRSPNVEERLSRVMVRFGFAAFVHRTVEERDLLHLVDPTDALAFLAMDIWEQQQARERSGRHTDELRHRQQEDGGVAAGASALGGSGQQMEGEICEAPAPAPPPAVPAAGAAVVSPGTSSPRGVSELKAATTLAAEARRYLSTVYGTVERFLPADVVQDLHAASAVLCDRRTLHAWLTEDACREHTAALVDALRPMYLGVGRPDPPAPVIRSDH